MHKQKLDPTKVLDFNQIAKKKRMFVFFYKLISIDL